MERKVYEILDAAVIARRNCSYPIAPKPTWENKWDDLIQYICKNHLPSGSGFDCGTTVVEDECVSGKKLVLKFDYHHMDEHGYYDGWSSHKVIVTPYFDGISVTVKGALPRKYRNDKEYFGDTLMHHLTSTIAQSKIDEILNVNRGSND